MSESDKRLVTHLKDVHALEQTSLKMLEHASSSSEDAKMKAMFELHLEETREHETLVKERLEAHDADSSMAKDVAQKAAAVAKSLAAAAPKDMPARLARDGFVQEHAEIAAYEILSRIADHAGDRETAEVARRILAQERAMAERIAAEWDHAVGLALVKAGAE